MVLDYFVDASRVRRAFFTSPTAEAAQTSAPIHQYNRGYRHENDANTKPRAWRDIPEQGQPLTKTAYFRELWQASQPQEQPWKRQVRYRFAYRHGRSLA